MILPKPIGGEWHNKKSEAEEQSVSKSRTQNLSLEVLGFALSVLLRPFQVVKGELESLHQRLSILHI